jgi:hypothetical protein
MKVVVTLSLFACFVSSLPSPGATCTSGYAATSLQALRTQPLYRYRSKKGNLLYTTSAELPKGLSNGPWRNDGVVCHVPSGPNHQVPAKAVYQLVKSDNLGVRYAYTSNAEEAGAASGWSNTGLAFYVAVQQQAGSVPLYRLYKPVPPPPEMSLMDKLNESIWGVEVRVPPGSKVDTHFYTTDESVKAEALGKGYQYQGILGYVWLAPYPPPAKPLPDITVFSTKADESSVTVILMNNGKANTGGTKFHATLTVYDQNGKLAFEISEPAPGLSPNQKDQMIFRIAGANLFNKRYRVTVDSANVLRESDENNNQSEMAEAPRRNLISPKVDPNAVRPPSIALIDQREEKAKDGTPRVTYTLEVTNWDSYPAEWFQDLTVIPPAICEGRPTPAQMLLHIFAESGGKQYKGGCKPLRLQTNLKTVSTIAFGGQFPVPEKIFVVLEDRAVGAKYTASSVVVGAFGVDKALFPLGCKRFLGRATDFLCTKKLGFDACENLRKQGKPINCRLAGGGAAK